MKSLFLSKNNKNTSRTLLAGFCGPLLPVKDNLVCSKSVTNFQSPFTSDNGAETFHHYSSPLFHSCLLFLLVHNPHDFHFQYMRKLTHYLHYFHLKLHLLLDQNHIRIKGSGQVCSLRSTKDCQFRKKNISCLHIEIFR